jgi:citrate lyase beta subunit
MESYFFIPGNKLANKSMIMDLGVSEIIIDMEDSVKESERKLILEEIAKDETLQNNFIRIPFYNPFNEELDISTLVALLKLGFRKFVFPKLNSADDFELIAPHFEKFNIKIILLVETPRFFFDVKEILLKYQKYFAGIGIGSHDFMSIIGGIHNLKNIEYIRQQILYLARMANITAIDIASMELRNAIALENEIIDGFQKGYDAKFFIHPWQMNIYKSIKFYTEAEYQWALQIVNELNKVGNYGEFNPIVINDQIIERPHLNRMQKILNYYNYATK